MAKHTSWWKPEYDSGWERAKEAFRRDWEQTKHDFGALAPDLNQNVADTVKQATGKEPIPHGNLPNFDDHEPAIRYGYGAGQHYRERAWGDELENELRDDYPGDYDRDREFIRYSYQNASTMSLRR